MDKALAYLSTAWFVPAGTVRLEPIHGGLESRVARGTLTTEVRPQGRPRQFVVKELRGRQRREASIYRAIWRTLTAPPAARVLGIHRSSGAHYLFLEDVGPGGDWPWRDHAAASAVCRQLARLHDSRGVRLPMPSWDYEAELLASASSTLDAASNLCDRDGRRLWMRLAELHRVVLALPAIRARLLDREATLLHGDVHPGNVMLRPGARREGPACSRTDEDTRSDDGQRVALIDWGRARIGSPLEDVASWLHSLGCWEPESRRRHDSLLQAYLAARAVPRRLTREVREGYWLASACNGLSGAIRYNLAVLADREADDAARANAERALREWQRLIRGAASILRRESAR